MEIPPDGLGWMFQRIGRERERFDSPAGTSTVFQPMGKFEENTSLKSCWFSRKRFIDAFEHHSGTRNRNENDFGVLNEYVTAI